MSTYHYAGDNPIMMNDPSGNAAAPVGNLSNLLWAQEAQDPNFQYFNTNSTTEEDNYIASIRAGGGGGGFAAGDLGGWAQEQTDFNLQVAGTDAEVVAGQQYQEALAASTSVYHAGDGSDDDPTTGNLLHGIDSILGGTASFAITLVNAPGYTGNGNFKATFEITGNEGSNITGLQIINTVYSSVSGGLWHGKCNWDDDNGTTYVGFVDGGPNAGPRSQNNPLDLTHPYYYTPGELKSANAGAMSWDGNTGYITYNDNPDLQNRNSDVHFEMIVVGTNYEGSNMDYVIGDYRISWKSGVLNGTPFKNYNSVSPEAMRIINYDYRNYKFYNGN